MRKTKIKYLFNIESEYKENLNFDLDDIHSAVPKILDNLFLVKEISDSACFFGMDFKNLSFDILFTDDIKIQKINREDREKDTPTDVITFALFADDDFKMVLDEEINLGEIIISVDTAKKQAGNNPLGIKNEILTLICHGILHLFGFDHQTEEDYNFIVDVQNRVLQAIDEGC